MSHGEIEIDGLPLLCTVCRHENRSAVVGDNCSSCGQGLYGLFVEPLYLMQNLQAETPIVFTLNVEGVNVSCTMSLEGRIR